MVGCSAVIRSRLWKDGSALIFHRRLVPTKKQSIQEHSATLSHLGCEEADSTHSELSVINRSQIFPGIKHVVCEVSTFYVHY
jgi:hypothetical protein